VRSGQYGSFDNLVISKVGSGEGTVTSDDGKIDCGCDCTEKYPIGAEVTLTAAATGGSTFAGWNGGGCTGMGQCVVTITDNATVTVTANFDLVSTSTTTVEQTTTSTSIQSATTTTTSIKPCVVKFFPASISKLVSLILPIRFFVISGEKGAEFTKDTAVVWDTEGIETINTFVLGRQNKFLLVQVFIQSQFLEASELYTVKVGDCFGTLKVRAF
jgi:hypothetical protein